MVIQSGKNNAPPERELGIQPLESILTGLKLSNHDLVRASTEQLTHKMVSKGRRGRRLSRNVQQKILQALNALSASRRFELADLFTYRG